MKAAKLHVFPASPNARKTIIANAAMGMNLALNVIDLRTGQQKSPEFLALNPNGRIPVLEFDDGSTLWESNAIINCMAGEADSDLWPRSNVRYDILRWQFWESCHWTPACAKFISRHLFKNENVDLEAAAADFHNFAGVLDGHLKGRDWLVGNSATTADVSVGAIFYLREQCQFPLDGYANIADWVARLEAMPAWNAPNEMMEPA